MIRFIQHLPGIEELRGQVETKHNEYDAIIKPTKKWLLDRGVTILTGCTVTDLNMDADCNTVHSIQARRDGGRGGNAYEFAPRKGNAKLPIKIKGFQS